jgi:hypothetical protein
MERVIGALLEAPVSPSARESAAPLIEKWIEVWGEKDAQDKTVAVECGFHIWVDSDTLVIGVQDRIAEDSAGFKGCEWKTAKEPKKYANGNDTPWWNEGVWLREISEGPQIAIYALAMKRGIYFPKQGNPFKLSVGGKNPRVLVRAVVKSSPPRFWPSDSGQSVFEFTPSHLAAVEGALLAKAVTIRALRKQTNKPWQLPGKHCFEFGRECQFFEKYCGAHQAPVLPGKNLFFNPSDPAYQLALPYVGKDELANPELVILSASSYQLASSCLEKFRIISGAVGGKDESLALDVGSAFHAGVGEFYKILMEEQGDKRASVSINQ